MDWIKKIKLICWDLDGTLYPSNDELKKHIDAIIIDTIALQHNYTKSQAKEKFYKIRNKVKSTTKSLDKLSIPGSKFFTTLWDDTDLSQYINLNQNLATKLQSSKISQAIFTNSNTQINIEKKLNLIGINKNVFSFIMNSITLGHTKPNKEVFEAIVKRSKLKPHEIIYAGDRDSVDIIPAKKNGLKTCMVFGESKLADINATNPEELLDLFEGFSNNNKNSSSE